MIVYVLTQNGNLFGDVVFADLATAEKVAEENSWISPTYVEAMEVVNG